MTVEQLLHKITGAKIAVIGDFCLDVYWLADMTKSVLSRETPHHPLPIVEERMSPGGAGNVAANAAALGPRGVTAIGVVGQDWRGDALRRLLNGMGTDTSGLIAAPDRVTNAYIKPLRRGINDLVYEDPRLDFENDTPQPGELDEQLISHLRQCDADVICVCDQMAHGVITPAVRDALCAMGRKGRVVIADSRERIGMFQDVIIKPNEVEAARAIGAELPPEQMAAQLHAITRAPVVLTLGEKGSLLLENGDMTRVPAVPVAPPIDICGAGDAYLAALACALAAGAGLAQAARLGALAASVTIKKLNQTGTATPGEILAAVKESEASA